MGRRVKKCGRFSGDNNCGGVQTAQVVQIDLDGLNDWNVLNGLNINKNMSLFPAQRTTPLPGGYMGTILRADLTSGTLRDENLPEEPIFKKVIGGQSLALYILLNELTLNATTL
jgi:hypothetical protein